MDNRFISICLTIFMLWPAAYLCIHTAADSLKISLRRAYVQTTSVTLIFSILAGPIDGYYFNMFVPAYLYFAFLYCKRVISLGTDRLLMLLFIAAHYACFSVVTTQVSNMYFGDGWWEIVSNLVLIVITLPPTSIILKKKIWPLLKTPHSTNVRYLWVIPLMFGLLTTLILIAFNYTEESAWVYMLFNVVVFGASIAAYIIIAAVLQQTVQNVKWRERASAMDRQLTLERQQYEDIRRGIDKARAIRHDQRHQYSVISSYAQSKNWEELVAYIAELTESLTATAETMYCENLAANALLNHYATIASQNGIDLSIKMVIPHHMGKMSDSDICVVLGNLMENAIEACVRAADSQSFIRMESHIDGRFWALKVVNNYDGKYQPSGSVYASRKRRDSGIGLSSVKAICEEYNGLASYTPNKEQWEANVVVNIFDIEKKGNLLKDTPLVL